MSIYKPELYKYIDKCEEEDNIIVCEIILNVAEKRLLEKFVPNLLNTILVFSKDQNA